MKFSLRTLGIGMGLLALLYGTLLLMERRLTAAERGDATQNHRLGPRASGERGLNEAKRQRLKRARKLSSAEAEKLFWTIIIPRLDFKDVSLEQAVDFLNVEVAKQIAEGQPKPSIRMDPEFLNTIKERRESNGNDVDMGLEEALGGLAQPIGIEAYRIAEMRMANIPVEVALREICAATDSAYFFYQGDCYLIGDRGGAAHVMFYYDEGLGRIRLQNMGLDQVATEINKVVSGHEYYGLKEGVEFRMSENALNALRSGELDLPKINLEAEDATVDGLMGAMAKLPNIHFVEVRPGELIYDPLGEYQEYQEHARKLNPFEPPTANGDPFTVPLDENWRHRERESSK